MVLEWKVLSRRLQKTFLLVQSHCSLFQLSGSDAEFGYDKLGVRDLRFVYFFLQKKNRSKVRKTFFWKSFGW